MKDFIKVVTSTYNGINSMGVSIDSVQHRLEDLSIPQKVVAYRAMLINAQKIMDSINNHNKDGQGINGNLPKDTRRTNE